MKTKYLAAITKAAIIGGALAPLAVFGWTGPSATPPNNNAEAPINVSASTQTKNGGLRVYGLRSFVESYFDQNVGIGNTSPGYKLEVTGNVGAQAFFYTSDKNLKKDISPLSKSLSSILGLQGVSFAWKDSGEQSIGLIAQDVEKIYPELVSTNPRTGIKSVEYGNLVAPLIEAIKEQQKQIDDLKAEVAALKANK